MKESLPPKITEKELELSKEKIEENLQHAKDTGRLLEQAYWEAVKGGSVQHHIQPKEERPDSLDPYGAFDPEKELTKIKTMPKKERREKFQEYKERLAYQKEGLARTQEELTDTIRNNPDIEWADLWKKAAEKIYNYGMTPAQELKILDILSRYYWKHLAIKEARAKFSDKNKLFEKIFGRPPRGKIEVIEGPVTLYFRCHNTKDYALISKQTFLENRNPIWSERKAARKEGGISIGTSLIPNLSGTIIAERAIGDFNDVQKEIYVHEEQHAIKRLFDERPVKELRPYETGGSLIEHFRIKRERIAELRVKDEILAFMKEGRFNPKAIFNILTRTGNKGGLYDYLAESKKELTALHSKNKSPDEKGEITKTIKQVFETEYHELIRKGIRSFQDLIDNGYTMEQTIALLNAEPLAKWPKVVKRLTQKQTT